MLRIESLSGSKGYLFCNLDIDYTFLGLVLSSPEVEDGRIYITSQTLVRSHPSLCPFISETWKSICLFCFMLFQLMNCSMLHEEHGVFSSALLTLYNSSWGQTYAMTHNNDSNNVT